ncbi:MAG: putative quinol monooxygenase [Alphaproteobacteria bacterium]|jgi:quinol monooxygenase YgiN|nr:putative quinol monooxygenase [Alphaproteobacteria bacterium]MDP6830813.1 putative quinol monooxygenase [Alphaproteobacteria bacterium]MDP6872677.1 putative quinol monooxygenase [Alphaproteobacteria bacterium]
MFATVATIKVKDGAEEQFLTLAKELAVAVKANEPGCQSYQICTGETARTYYIVERYEDTAAADAHRNSAHVKAMLEQAAPLLDGPPDILRLSEV